MSATTIRLSVCSRHYRVARPGDAAPQTYRLIDPAQKRTILRSYRLRNDNDARRHFRAGLVFGLDAAGVEVRP